MLSATPHTLPVPFCEAFEPSRTPDQTAIGTGLRRKLLIHFLKPCAMLNSRVREFVPKGRPPCVEDAFRHGGLGEFRGGHVAHRDVIKLLHDAVRELVLKVVAAVCRLRLDRLDAARLVRTLRRCQRFLCATVQALCFNFLARAQDSKILQAEVDADAAQWLTQRHVGYFDADVQEPVSARVAREVRTVLDLGADRQRAALEYLELTAVEVEAVRRFSQGAALERHPTERLLATPAQVGPLLLAARLRVLLADGVDRARVQAKLFAAAGCELVKVESGVPAATESQRVFLPLVAVVPDEVDRASLLVKQAIQGLDAVAVN